MKIDKKIMRGHLVNKICCRLGYILGNRIMKSTEIGGITTYFDEHKIFRDTTYDGLRGQFFSLFFFDILWLCSCYE